MNFIELPVGNIQPEGWLRRYLELQKNELMEHLNEVSAWLGRGGSVQLTQGGNHGQERVPYWPKRYRDLAYVLKDQRMIDEVKIWLGSASTSQQPDRYFGPVNERNGKRELWAQMIIL